MKDVIIRPEVPADRREIYEINTSAFGQEDEARLVELLRESTAYIPELSLIATWNDKLVGHILFSKISIVDKNQNEYESLALAPMAVRPEFQNRGIGGRLIQSGLNKARELNYKSVIVAGHERYYPKFGFLPAETWNIKAPFEIPTNAFMGIELIADGLKGISGTVKYSEEFGIL
jgi:putative acetyltransferase